MPPLPIVPSVARFQLHTQLTGGPLCLTRFFMRYTAALGGSDATTLLTTLNASWLARIAPQTANTVNLTYTSVVDLGSRTGVNVTLPSGHAGTSASPALTAAAAMVISAKVAYRYRGGHSRVYIPGLVTTGFSDTNTWSVTEQGLMFTAWTGMLSDLTASPPIAVGALSQVAVHAYSSNPLDFPGGTPPGKAPWPLATPVVYPISSWQVNPQLGSQRRRNQQP